MKETMYHQRAKELVSQMTLDEKLSMIGGIHGFYTVAVDRLGVSSLFMSDASQGVNVRSEWLGEPMTPALKQSTAFPCLVQLASTWDSALARRYAAAVGEECRAGGIHVLLGPGMNIYRQSQCGRNFEYLGEDPFLAASMIREYVTGVQGEGVVATLKHLVANNTDFYRRKSNSVVDDRALREIYLPAFQAGIEAGAKAIMTSYNLINGEWCSQNRELITTVLRGELGFDWLVMTDWWAVNDAEKVIRSGQDLEMPAAQILADTGALIEDGSVSETDIDRMVISQVATALSMDLYRDDYRAPELIERLPEHEAVALQTAREGTVLLRNTGVLPLAADAHILLTGRFAREKAFGGGAAEVEGFAWKTMEEALGASFSDLRFVENPSTSDLEWADAVIVSTGTLDHEGWDRPFALPPEEEQTVSRIARAHSATIVVVNAGGGIRMTGWADDTAAIVYGWYGGQTGNQALAEILSGAVNPSGKLPITIEREFDDSPGAGYMPPGEEFYSDWNSDEEEAHAVYDVIYSEGVFVGYRWYDTKDIEPLYPFGHGLSYTTFDYSDLSVSAASLGEGEAVNVTCTVRNIGSVRGTEVIQLYVGSPGKIHPRPIKELKGIARIELGPGEAKVAQISIDATLLRYWDPDRSEWRMEPGTHRILVGASSRDIRLEGAIELI